MSTKAKNLEYDNTQPAFLQRLRGQLAGDGSGRHERPIPRNKRMQKDEDDDDAPTYVVEESNDSMTKAEYEALLAGDDAAERTDVADQSSDRTRESEAQNAHAQQSKERIAEVGAASKKRKAVKVIGGEDGEDGDKVRASKVKVEKKPKKKAKLVKLSFED